MANRKRVLKADPNAVIDFKVVRNIVRKKPCYRAVVENGRRMGTELYAEWLSKLGCTLDRRMIEMVLNFIRDYTPYIVAKTGARVDVGPFTVYPAVLGSFPAPDAEFDPKRNRLVMRVSPRMDFKYTTGGIRLRNVTKSGFAGPRVTLVTSMERQDAADEIIAGAEALLTGKGIGVDKTRADEGVTLRRKGKEDAACEIVRSHDGFMNFNVPAGLSPGRWQLELRCRGERGADAAPYVLRQPVTVVEK